MERAAIAALSTLLVVGAVLIGVTIGKRDAGPGPRADPAEAERVVLPEPEPDSPSADDVLTGSAALVATFRELTAPLLQLDSVAGVNGRYAVCAEVAEALNGDVDPVALLEAAGAISDPVLSELAANQRVALSDTLIACGARNAEATEEALRDVLAIEVLFDRRMGQL